MKSFTAQLSDIANLTQKNIEYVARSAISDVMERAQTAQDGFGRGATSFVEGRVPVDTSALINSLTVDGAKGADSYAIAIAGLRIGDTMRFAWTAKYAMAMELGFTANNGRRIPGRYFVSRNAERFSEFVKRRVAEVV